MATALIKVQLYSGSFGLTETLEGICRRVEAKGYPGCAQSVGSNFGIIPNWGDVVFRVYGVRESDMARVEKDVKSEIGWNFVNSWKNLVTTFEKEVVTQTVADVGTVVKETAETVKKGATGIGLGIGFGLVLLGAAYLLVLRGGRA